MTRVLAAIAMVLMVASAAGAEVRSLLICKDKTLAASTTTDCDKVDISGFKFFSFQVSCAETTGSDMQIDVDWVAASAAGNITTYAVPILSTGSAMPQLISNRTTETTWSTLQSIQPPVSPMATIRLTEDNADADVVCSVVLNMGN